jgi:histone-lysine N-methyltransferase SETMAR
LDLNRILHPPYSPDISPCDFWLFGFLKGWLKGRQSTSDQELPDIISAVLSDIIETEFFVVYEEYIERLKEVIRTHGEYFTK